MRAASDDDSLNQVSSLVLGGGDAVPQAPSGVKEDRYYTKYGRASDALLRCKDCKRLVTHGQLAARGCCPSCGTRKVTEITTLSIWEWLKVRVGWLDFPYRREFLAEFRAK